MVQKLNSSTNSNTIGIRQSQVTTNKNECWRQAYQNLQKEHLTLKEKYRQSGCVIAKMRRESGKKDKAIAKLTEALEKAKRRPAIVDSAHKQTSQ